MNLTTRARLYLSLVVLSGVSIAIYYIPRFDLTKQVLFTLLAFSVIAFLTEIYEIEIIYKRYTSTSIAIYTAAILLGGAPLAVWVALLALLPSESILRFEALSKKISAFFTRLSFNTSQILISVFVASAIFKLTNGHPPPYQTLSEYIPCLLAFLAYTITNTSLVSGIISLTEGVSFFYHLKFNLKHLPVQLLSMGILSILIAVVYSISPWNIILLLIPLALVHISLRQYTKLRQDAKDAFRKMNDLLKERDPYTAEHSEQVATLSEKIARQMGLPEERVERIKSAARIHDIGKIGIPDEILLKPGNLNDEEWKQMKEHPVIGADMIKDLEIYKDAEDIIKHEHEQWDGSGYPDGLEGEDIPLGARIVAAADTYSAMTTDRPYRKALSKQEALEEIERVKGKQLDPKVAEALIEVVK